MSRRTSSTLNSSVFPKPCTGDSPSNATLLPHNACTIGSVSLVSVAGPADWPAAGRNATPMQIDKQTIGSNKSGLLKENATDMTSKRDRDRLVSVGFLAGALREVHTLHPVLSPANLVTWLIETFEHYAETMCHRFAANVNHYCDRNATIGSIRVIRAVGTKHAAIAIDKTQSETARIMSGLLPLTPKSRLLTNLRSNKAAPMPAINPIATGVRLAFMTKRRKFDGLAPNAIRSPISNFCCSTEYETTL